MKDNISNYVVTLWTNEPLIRRYHWENWDNTLLMFDGLNIFPEGVTIKNPKENPYTLIFIPMRLIVQVEREEEKVK